jgi:hypothetical protein
LTKHTVLFLAANPLRTDRLALDEEARSIHEELERSGHRNQFELVTRWATRPLDLLRELRKLKPTVVHFSGHGGRGEPGERARTPLRRDIVGESDAVDGDYEHGLFFQGPDGRPQLVTSAALKETFGAAGASVRLVVLNACYSEVQAEALSPHVDCVVGMSGAIRDDAARSYAIGFYGGLGERESIAAAHQQGCAAISLEGLDDADRPRLKTRSGVDATQIILAAAQETSRRGASALTTAQAERVIPDILSAIVSENSERSLATAQLAMPDPGPERQTTALRGAYLPFAALVKEKTRNFVGRRWLFHAIDRHLLDRENFPSGYILITGEPGIGKSALMAQLVKERGWIHHFNNTLQGIASPKHFLANLSAQLTDRYRLPHTQLPDDAHKDGLFLARLLQEVSEVRKDDEPLVLVVDALDETERAGAANPLFLPPALPDRVYVVATTRPGDLYRLSVMRLRELALDGRSKENRSDVREYIDAYREKEGVHRWIAARTLEPEEFTDLLQEKSEGNFMYLYHVLQDITLDRLKGFPLEDLPQGLRDYYRRHWQTMRAHAGELSDEIYKLVVCVLGAVREAVSEEQVAEWTDVDPREVRRVLADWREFLYKERGKEGQWLWRIYHTSFQDYLMEEIDPGLKTYHAMIAQSVLRKIERVRNRGDGNIT